MRPDRHTLDRKLLWLSAVVCLVALGAALLFTTRANFPSVKGPRVRLPGCDGLSLGAGKPGETLEGSFEIENVGSEPLKFRLQSSCGRCSFLRPDSGEVEPGGKQLITVGVRLRKRGHDENVTVILTTNDPTEPAINYPVLASCAKIVAATPTRVDFGLIPMGHEAAKTVEITSSSTNIASLATAASKHLSVRQVGSASATKAMFEIQLSASAPRGQFLGQATFSVADDEEDVHVVGQTLGKIEKVEGPDWVTVADDHSGPAKRRCLKVTFAAPDHASPNSAVRVWFRNSPHPAELVLVP